MVPYPTNNAVSCVIDLDLDILSHIERCAVILVFSEESKLLSQKES